MRRLISFLAAAFVLCGFGLFSENGTVITYDLDYSGIVEYAKHGTPTACWDFETAVGNYTDDCDGTIIMTNNGAAVRVDDATWPNTIAGAQGMSWRFDGAADYLNRADDGTFDFAGDFSIVVVVTPHTVAAGEDCIAAKWETTGNERGWKICRDANDVLFSVSVDGTAITTASSLNTLVAHRPAFITAVYLPGTTTANIYVDNAATGTSGAMAAGLNDSAADFEIGASDTGATLWDGLISDVMAQPRALSETQHDEAFSRWQGRSSTAGDSTRATVASAAPPAIIQAPAASGTEPFLIDQPANSFSIGSPAAGSGGMYGAAALSNLCFRSSIETWAAGAPTGWTETIAGGTSDATENTTNMAHQGSSAQMFCDGVNNVSLDSGCTAMAATTAYYLSGFFQTTVGAANFSLQLIEYTDAACTVGAVTTTVYNGDPGANWIKHGGTRTTGGAVQSGQVRLLMSANNATILADAIQLRAAAYPTDAYAGCDTDAACVTNHVLVSANSPLSANGTTQVDVTMRSPWDATALAGAPYMWVDGNVGANNSMGLFVNTVRDEPTWILEDNAGATLLIGPNVSNWMAETDYELRMYHDGTGQLGLYWNATWYTTEVGVGTGMRSAAQADTNIGRGTGTGSDVWSHTFRVFRSIHP